MHAPRLRPSLLAPALLSLLLGVGLAGCDTLNCEDGGRLEAAYLQGQDAARAQNDAEYQLGLSEGLALSFEDGEAEGYRAGFDDGYAAGFWESGNYQAGYASGFELGFEEGYATPAACEGGDEAGYAEGFSLGDSDGYALGYGAGYDDSYRPCALVSDDPAAPQADDEDAPGAKEIGQCHSRGVRSLRDAESFLRGRNAGIAENADYLEGFDQQYAIGFADGDSEGRLLAYDEGVNQGYGDGADEGWQSAWLSCYDAAYPEGYQYGYELGYAAGYGDGSSQGDTDAGC